MASAGVLPKLGLGRSQVGLILRARVIEAARRRARRRRLAVLAAVALTAIAAGALAVLRPAGLLGSGTSPAHVAPSAVLSATQPPYMGVACPQPNAIACDRVGLAVWLRRPALSVEATIAGRRLALDWAGDRPPRFASQRARRAFTGFLQPAGLTSRLHVAPTSTSGLDPGCVCQTGSIWFGDNAPSPLVRLQIRYANREHVVTRLRVILAAGWG